MRNSSFRSSKQKPWLRDRKGGVIRLKSIFVKMVILILTILTFGCSAITQLSQDGIGQPISTIIDQSGRPTRVTSDGSGGSIYIWEHWVDRGYGDGYLWSTKYWVDSNGIIYGWK
jgi:hypothetical protein